MLQECHCAIGQTSSWYKGIITIIHNILMYQYIMVHELNIDMRYNKWRHDWYINSCKKNYVFIYVSWFVLLMF